MRFVGLLVAVALFPAPLALAANLDSKILDATQIAALESKALQAAPREQCFIYAELVHSMTEIAGQQMQSGNMEQASVALQSAKSYAEKIHMGLANDTKKLKNAEILIRHTAFRLKAYLSGASLDDRPTLEATLKQLDQVQSELMMQVFKH